jgi:hypothetical protein
MMPSVTFQLDPREHKYHGVGAFVFCCALLFPVLYSYGFSWLSMQTGARIYVVFIGLCCVLLPFSSQITVSGEAVLETWSVFKLPVFSKLLVHRHHLKHIEWVSKEVWEHAGAQSGMYLDGYIHEVNLVTLDNRHHTVVRFKNADKEPHELIEVLCNVSGILNLPVNVNASKINQ